MTIRMPDSVTPGDINMVDAKAAVLGYVDGNWPTARQLPALFPGAKIIRLTVLGRTLDADGIDVEPGNPSNGAMAAEWVKAKLAADPGSRPVVYADLASPSYSMSEVLADLAALDIARARVRVLTAHYDGEHICSPAQRCKDKDNQVITWTADGTQWTKTYPGVGGKPVDMSLLAADFFGPVAPPANWVFNPVQHLQIHGTVEVDGKPVELGVGPHSVKAAWDAPAGPAPEAVHHYQGVVRHLGQDVAAAADIPKLANPQVWQWNNLRPGTPYELFVRAVAINGHASTWAVADFATGQA